MGRDRRLFDMIAERIIQQESYPSSGGMAARDLAALNIGLQEAVDNFFLKTYIQSIRILASHLKKNQVTIFEPVGAHGIVIIPRSKAKYSGYSLAAEVFQQSGVRAGVFDDLYRLAIPRRVYSQEQLKFAAEEISRVYHKPLPRLRMTNNPGSFINFFARFKKI
jgi:tryptophanase